MTADLLAQALIRGAALGGTVSVALAIYLVCLRFVVWDLVPASCLPQAHWWQRHARSFLRTSLAVTATALVALVVLRSLT